MWRRYRPSEERGGVEWLPGRGCSPTEKKHRQDRRLGERLRGAVFSGGLFDHTHLEEQCLEPGKVGVRRQLHGSERDPIVVAGGAGPATLRRGLGHRNEKAAAAAVAGGIERLQRQGVGGEDGLSRRIEPAGGVD